MKRKLSDADIEAANNLKRIWEEKKDILNINQEKAYPLLGFTTQGAVSHYINARTPLNTDATIKFAALLKVDPAEIDSRVAELIKPVLHLLDESKYTIPVPNKVPLITWDTASVIENAKDLPELQIAGWRYCPIDIKEGSYALMVSGISMQPEFKNGATIFVDPFLHQNIAQHDNTRFLVVKRPADGEAILRELFVESGKKYLKAVNPAWHEPIFELTPDIKVCGVVIGQWIAY